ncbi:MAG: hypothetical protein ABSF23_13955 [Terracidiphilus sp.]|jgi:hypothetical protein
MAAFIRGNLLIALFAGLALVCGCGGNPAVNCSLGDVEVRVTPTSATIDHAAAPPGNQIQFVGVAQPTAPIGCPLPTWVAISHATWSNPDPVDIQISSANDATNGTAICKSPTNGAVTLTGTFTQVVTTPVAKTVQLTCN